MSVHASHKKLVLGHNLRALRLEKHLTQEAVSSRANLSRRIYQGLEAGQGNPTLETLVALANTFNVTTARLVQLNALRVPESLDVFFAKFQKQFDEFQNGIGLRTVDGISFWWNKSVGSRLGSDVKWPLNLLEYYKGAPECEAILRAQLECERRGWSQPYIVLSNSILSDKGAPYRIYPTVIYSANSDRPVWTSVFSILLADDTNEAYYAYCSKLLELVIGSVRD